MIESPAANIMNPVRRVLEVIQSAKGSKPGQKGQAISDVWADVFQVKKDDTFALYQRLAKLCDQLDIAERQLRRLPINHELYLRVFPDVKKGFASPTLNEHWRTADRYFADGSLVALEFAAAELDKHYPEEVIEDEKLKELRFKITSLFDGVKEAKIDPSIQEPILEILSIATRSIDDYRIHGAAGMKAAVCENIGRVVDLYRQQIDAGEEERGWMKKVVETVREIDYLVSVAMKYRPLLESGSKVLSLSVGGS